MEKKEFDQRYTQIKRKAENNESLRGTISSELKRAYDAVTTYMKTLKEIEGNFKEYIDGQNEFMFSDKYSQDIAVNIPFAGIKPVGSSEEARAKLKELNDLSEKLKADLYMSESLMHVSITSLQSVLKNLGVYMQEEGDNVKEIEDLLRDLDSPHDFYMSLGKNLKNTKNFVIGN